MSEPTAAQVQTIRGIETTVYTYPFKEGSTVAYDRTKPATGSVANFYHDCGGEWTSVNETSYEDGKTFYKHKCSGCGQYGRGEIRYLKVKT